MGAMLERSVQRLVEGDVVSDASVMQHRDARAKIAIAVGVVVGIVLAAVFDGGALVSGAAVGVVAGISQVPFVQNWVLARVGDEVVLCRSSSWFGSAKEITHRKVVVSRTNRGVLADTYGSPVGELMSSGLRCREVARILRV